MCPEKNSFTKAERLCSKKMFAELFDNGNSFNSFPFRVVWTDSPVVLSFPSQIAVSVPKRVFKRAVDRNLIKRRIKEAFRTNKHELYNFLELSRRQIVFVIIYRYDKIPDYKKTEKAVHEMIKKLIACLSERENKC